MVVGYPAIGISSCTW